MHTMVAAAEFRNYGPSHLGALVVFVLGAILIVWVGRRQRGSDDGLRFSRLFALMIPVITVPLQILQLTPGDWDLDSSLPLQLCDLAWMAAVYALWTHRPWAVGLTYYWGLTLTTQGIATPALLQDFPSTRYLMFWAMHFLIVWAAIYLVWGMALTPTWRVFRTAVAITAGWAVLIFTFNVVAGTNYGFLNRKPSTASLLDFLGPWPLYVVVEISIVVAVWALMTWPWVALRGTPARDASSVSQPSPTI